jgi:nitrate reductase beta subunit
VIYRKRSGHARTMHHLIYPKLEAKKPVACAETHEEALVYVDLVLNKAEQAPYLIALSCSPIPCGICHS